MMLKTLFGRRLPRIQKLKNNWNNLTTSFDRRMWGSERGKDFLISISKLAHFIFKFFPGEGTLDTSYQPYPMTPGWQRLANTACSTGHSILIQHQTWLFPHRSPFGKFMKYSIINSILKVFHNGEFCLILKIWHFPNFFVFWTLCFTRSIPHTIVWQVMLQPFDG